MRISSCGCGWKGGSRAALLASLSLSFVVGGCASARVAPEVRVAGALHDLAGRVDEFREGRRTTTRRRQELLGQEEVAAAELSADGAQRAAIWKLTGNQRRQATLDALRAATRASAESWLALEKLRAEERKKLEAADTKVHVDGELMAGIIKSLTALGAPQDIKSRLRSYAEFVIATRDAVDAQLAKGGADTSKRSDQERIAAQSDHDVAARSHLVDAIAPAGAVRTSTAAPAVQLPSPSTAPARARHR
jgi:hypothetical protein